LPWSQPGMRAEVVLIALVTLIQGHSTNLSLLSRNIAGEARGVLCILENADGSVVVGHAPTALMFLDIISGVVAANARRRAWALRLRSLMAA
jgi:precorrin isomerase